MPSPLDNAHDFSPLLKPSQWITLYALTSVVFQALDHNDIQSILAGAPAGSNPESIKAFAANESNYSNVEFRKYLDVFLSTKLPRKTVDQFAAVLDLLNSVPGCVLLTYSSTLFHLQPLDKREELIRFWLNPASTVLFPPIRAFAKAIVAITKTAWSRSISRDVLYGALGHKERIGYTGKADEKYRPFHKFEFLNFSSSTGQQDVKNVKEIEYDVVIVGSGCGGAVAAARLAKEGYKVVVVEKGIWYPTDQLPLPELQALEEIFEAGMTLTSDDGSIAFAAGTAFGGGGMINWAASLQTQGFVREEWAIKNGLPFFMSQDYQKCMDYVCNRMGVTDQVEHNHRNRVILEGSRKLGWRAITVPQNIGALLDGEVKQQRAHDDGYCCYGCGGREASEGRKMGTTQTWLPDAAKAGAKFIQDFYVDRIIFSDEKKTKAIGVEGTWGAKIQGGRTVKVTIKAKKVIISSGSIHTPAILMRSGLTNPNIGENFHAHPVCLMTGFFPTPTNPMSGSILTTACTEFENLDGLGHGVKLEASAMPPVLWMRTFPFNDHVQLKRHFLDHHRAGCFLALLKEKNPGRVYCDPTTGLPRISYTPSVDDRAMLLKGVVALSKLLFIEGAEEIVPYHFGMPTFKRHPTTEELALEKAEENEELEKVFEILFCNESLQTPIEEEEREFDDPGINDKRFQRWLKKLEDYGLPLPQSNFISAHQMGSCRMGSNEFDSVVNDKGKVWGSEGLFLADSSVFPSASGVNPMITVMAIAHHIAGEIVKELRVEDEK
ncbi:hypothetical protein DFP73DRAFT_52674 [Morchella snyderi]|nr:hypothetical protein DFP73DRAFT_52674 [Morchella snyderi]